MALISLVKSEDASSGEGVKLRDEDDVNKLREEALAKLEVPLEKMKIKAILINIIDLLDLNLLHVNAGLEADSDRSWCYLSCLL